MSILATLDVNHDMRYHLVKLESLALRVRILYSSKCLNVFIELKLSPAFNSTKLSHLRVGTY